MARSSLALAEFARGHDPLPRRARGLIPLAWSIAALVLLGSPARSMATQESGAAADELAAETAAPEPTLQPDAVDLLRQMIARYGDMESMHIAGEMLTKAPTPVGPREMSWEFDIAVEIPGRHMSKSKNPMFSIHTIFDGETTWTWVDNQNVYTEINGSEGGPGTQIPMPGVNFDTAQPEEELLGPILGARELERSTATIGEESFDCRVLELVVETPAGGPMPGDMPPAVRRIYLREKDLVAIRIEEDRRLPAMGVRPAQEMSIVVTLSELSYDEPLDDGLFTFTPPEGSTQVDELPLPGRAKPSSMEGKPAGEFELEDLDGATVSLASLKGKVVLLDFWASWCGPCKMELPHVDKLAQEFTAKGLAVYGVNSEPVANAQRFLKKTPLSFPTLVDTASRVSQQYQVTGLPTVVVIDREGVVSAFRVGYQSEEALRGLLKEAGIE